MRLARKVLSIKELNQKDKEVLSNCLLDFLASIFVGLRTKTGKHITRKYIEKNNYDGVAFLLAYLAEISEYNHGHHWGAAHVSSSVLPTTLAISSPVSHLEISNEALSIATVAGYEAVCKYASNLMPELKDKWTSNATGFGGAIAAAAVCSSAMNFSEEDTNTALGFAAYLSPMSPQQGYTTGAHGFETASAVCQGILATRLSSHLKDMNMGGPMNIVDSYLSHLKGGVRLSKNDNSLAIYNLYFKPYPTCGGTHGVIQGIKKLIDMGVQRDQVEKIKISTTNLVNKVANHMYPLRKLDFVERQFSIKYLAAASFEDIDLSHIVFNSSEKDDIRRLKFAKEKIKVSVEESHFKNKGRSAVKIEAMLFNGDKKTVHIDHPRGSVGDPLDFKDVRLKFREVALQEIGVESVEWEKDCLSLNWRNISKRLINYLFTL